MNKREWLVREGLAKPGRGRLSAEAHYALEWADQKGLIFDDEVPYVKFTFTGKPKSLKKRTK